MSKKRVGLLALGAVVRGVPQRRALPQTNAGGNVQVYLEDGNRIVAWKGSQNYEIFSRLRDGDTIDFSFSGLKPGEFRSASTGQMVDYYEYQGIKMITKPETLEISGIAPGEAGTIPEALADRPLAEEIAPKQTQTMSSDVPLEGAGADDTATSDAEC